MTASDLAAVVIAVVGLLATAVLVVVVQAVVRTLRELRVVLDALRSETVPLVTNLRRTVDQAGVDLERAEGILDSAERIASTVDSASQLTYRAFSPPLIKTVSFVAGLRRAARRLRGTAFDEAPVAKAPPHPTRTPRGRRGRVGRASTHRRVR